MSFCLSLCMFESSFWPTIGVDFSEILHDYMVLSNLKRGLNILENCYNGDEKEQKKKVFWPKHPWSYGYKTCYAYTTSLWE